MVLEQTGLGPWCVQYGATHAPDPPVHQELILLIFLANGQLAIVSFLFILFFISPCSWYMPVLLCQWKGYMCRASQSRFRLASLPLPLSSISWSSHLQEFCLPISYLSVPLLFIYILGFSYQRSHGISQVCVTILFSSTQLVVTEVKWPSKHSFWIWLGAIYPLSS